jgi:hypothetical protein
LKKNDKQKDDAGPRTFTNNNRVDAEPMTTKLQLGHHFSSKEELERVLEVDEQGIAILARFFYKRDMRFLHAKSSISGPRESCFFLWGKSDSDNIQLVQTNQNNGTT